MDVPPGQYVLSCHRLVIANCRNSLLTQRSTLVRNNTFYSKARSFYPTPYFDLHKFRT